MNPLRSLSPDDLADSGLEEARQSVLRLARELRAKQARAPWRRVPISDEEIPF